VSTGDKERSDDAPDAPDATDAPRRHRPRGGTPIALGAGLGIDDFDAVATLGGVCDRLGIDVISAGNTVAWAVRASDAGLIDPADHGVDRGLSFGDEAAARALIEEIAARSTPLGDALADGVAAAAERFGGTDLVPTVKGMELASYDPRRRRRWRWRSRRATAAAATGAPGRSRPKRWSIRDGRLMSGPPSSRTSRIGGGPRCGVSSATTPR